MSEETYRLLRILQAERDYLLNLPDADDVACDRYCKVQDFIDAAIEFHLDSHEPKV